MYMGDNFQIWKYFIIALEERENARTPISLINQQIKYEDVSYGVKVLKVFLHEESTKMKFMYNSANSVIEWEKSGRTWYGKFNTV